MCVCMCKEDKRGEESNIIPIKTIILEITFKHMGTDKALKGISEVRG